VAEATTYKDYRVATRALPGSLEISCGGAEFAAIHDLSPYHCGYWGAAEGAAVEGRVAGFAGGFGCVVRPGVFGGKNRESGGAADGDFSFDAEDARGAGGEKFDEARERNFSGVNEFAER
jgi:hypothetical protein